LLDVRERAVEDVDEERPKEVWMEGKREGKREGMDWKPEVRMIALMCEVSW
jgi:hypothetical protein